ARPCKHLRPTRPSPHDLSVNVGGPRSRRRWFAGPISTRGTSMSSNRVSVTAADLTVRLIAAAAGLVTIGAFVGCSDETVRGPGNPGNMTGTMMPGISSGSAGQVTVPPVTTGAAGEGQVTIPPTTTGEAGTGV